MHPNLSAYNDYEVFNSIAELLAYRDSKLKDAKKNISFVKQHLKRKLRVLEIGSGNSKFLYALHSEDMLEQGYGIEISKSRVNFADKWKKDLGIENVYNIEANVLEAKLYHLPPFDLVYCVDLAFQFLDPIDPGSDFRTLKSMYNRLGIGGKIILELDCHHRFTSKMVNGKIRTWQELEDPDPWRYLLWNCELEEEQLHIDRIFIKRDLSKTSRSKVILKNYQRSDMIYLLSLAGFDNIKSFENWNEENDLLDDEFIMVGEKPPLKDTKN